ncbi:hypothetical protein ACFE04_005752 [Oxalis oulophora]
MRKPCCDKRGTNNKGAWSKQEDQKLIDYVKHHGEGSWRALPKAAGIDHILCHLPEVESQITQVNKKEKYWLGVVYKTTSSGNVAWSLIAGRLPGRTDNEVKNYWNSHIKRKLINMGIDPSNHKLNQILPRPQALAISCAQSKSRNDVSNPKITSDNEKVSDSTSSPKDETMSSALNLNLSIASPSRNGAVGDYNYDQLKNGIDQSMVINSEVSIDTTVNPTLLLFT